MKLAVSREGESNGETEAASEPLRFLVSAVMRRPEGEQLADGCRLLRICRKVLLLSPGDLTLEGNGLFK